MWALDIAEGRKPLVRSLHVTDKLGSLSESRAFLKVERQKAEHNARNKDALMLLRREDNVLPEILFSNTTKAILHVFVARSMTSKVPGVSDVGLKPRNIKKVAVIGGGLMGSSIITALLLSNIHVLLKEDKLNPLPREYNLFRVSNMRNLEMKQELVKDKVEKALSLLKGVLDYSKLKDVDMVIETVAENISLKQTIFSELEKACPPHCILATNTSTIDLNVIGETTNSQERIVGAHFFSPEHVTPLLEIVRTNETSAQVILDLITVAKTMKKVPVVVGNCTGFAVNRTFFPYFQSAHLLLNLGVDIFRIDRVIIDFGMLMGPFHFKSPLVELLVKNRRKGKANGKGYYIYEQGSKPKPDPSVLSIIESSRRLTSIMPGDKVKN
ncbi:Peroxisomal fatty acid beta-oxidation multifunctional protein AIM1 [Bienertia sinuspersici]